jgi:hypothetical protein
LCLGKHNIISKYLYTTSWMYSHRCASPITLRSWTRSGTRSCIATRRSCHCSITRGHLPLNKLRRLCPKNLDIAKMNWYTTPTVAECIVRIAVGLRNARIRSTSCSVVAREDTGLSAVSYVLRETWHARWIAHLDDGDNWVVSVGQRGLGEGRGIYLTVLGK